MIKNLYKIKCLISIFTLQNVQCISFIINASKLELESILSTKYLIRNTIILHKYILFDIFFKDK